MGLGGRIAVRVAVVVATVASLLAPTWVAPARAITVPITMAETIPLDDTVARRSTGALRLAFPATHVAFRWVGTEDVTISYRSHAEGEWQVAPIAHDADDGRNHYTGVVAVDRPETLEWTVDVAPGDRIEGLTLDYLNTLDGPRETRRIPATARAEANTPRIITRAEWGADESLKRTSGGCQRVFHPLQQLFVHHTAGSNFDDQPKATMRAIYHYHTQTLGWCDIGYNFVVSYDGRIFEGRWARDYDPWEVHDSESKSGKPVVGAHVDGYNSGTVGVSVMGNFESAKPSPATRQALAELLAWEIDRHDLEAQGTHTYKNPETGAKRTLPWIAGHRDADTTSCPGNNLYAKLASIRRDAVAVMGNGKSSTDVAVSASTNLVNYGETVTIAGSLTDANDVALASRPIRTYVKEGNREWREGPRTTTGPDGSFAFTLQPKANLKVAAIYDGDRTTWGSESKVGTRVAPVVTLQTDGSTPDGAGVYHYPPGTTEIPFFGTVTPHHAGHSVRVVISQLQPDGTFAKVAEPSAQLDGNGGFSVDWNFENAGGGGTYQAYALFPKDDDHARAVSPVITFVVDPQP